MIHNSAQMNQMFWNMICGPGESKDNEVLQLQVAKEKEGSWDRLARTSSMIIASTLLYCTDSFTLFLKVRQVKCESE
jgi:hypothetical protein